MKRLLIILLIIIVVAGFFVPVWRQEVPSECTGGLSGPATPVGRIIILGEWPINSKQPQLGGGGCETEYDYYFF